MEEYGGMRSMNEGILGTFGGTPVSCFTFANPMDRLETLRRH